ncbi:unnamed protein product, partial [Nesidiocoris tenuis]
MRSGGADHVKYIHLVTLGFAELVGGRSAARRTMRPLPFRRRRRRPLLVNLQPSGKASADLRPTSRGSFARLFRIDWPGSALDRKSRPATGGAYSGGALPIA